MGKRKYCAMGQGLADAVEEMQDLEKRLGQSKKSKIKGIKPKSNLELRHDEHMTHCKTCREGMDSEK